MKAREALSKSKTLFTGESNKRQPILQALRCPCTPQMKIASSKKNVLQHLATLNWSIGLFRPRIEQQDRHTPTPGSREDLFRPVRSWERFERGRSITTSKPHNRMSSRCTGFSGSSSCSPTARERCVVGENCPCPQGKTHDYHRHFSTPRREGLDERQLMLAHRRDWREPTLHSTRREGHALVNHRLRCVTLRDPVPVRALATLLRRLLPSRHCRSLNTTQTVSLRVRSTTVHFALTSRTPHVLRNCICTTCERASNRAMSLPSNVRTSRIQK